MATVNMSLDDIIQANKKNKGGRKVGGLRSEGETRERSGGAKLAGRGRTFAFSDRVPEGKWKHDKFQDSQAPKGNPNKKVTINLSNLNPEAVTSADLEDLFEPYGIESAVVHYDANGTSLGTGAVVCPRAAAEQIVQEYKNVKLDGQMLKMTIVDTAAASAGGIKSRLEFINQRSGRISKPARTSGGGGGGVKPRRSGGKPSSGKHFLDRIEDSGDEGENKPRGGGGGGRGGRRGGRKEPKTQKTSEELDADLEAYMNKGKAMEA